MIISDEKNAVKNILLRFHAKNYSFFPKNCMIYECDDNAVPLNNEPDFVVSFLQFNKPIDFYEAMGYVKGSFFYSVIKKIEILFDLQ